MTLRWSQPQRILTYLKQSYPQHVYEQTFLSFFLYLWSASPQLDLSKQENIIYALQHTYFNTPIHSTNFNPQTKQPIFTSEEIFKIIRESSSEQIKDALKSTTEHCWKQQGAYGCPWFWVINDERINSSSNEVQTEQVDSNREHGEPFFGSDRWHYMYTYLGIPYQDIRILPPSTASPNGAEKEKLAKL
jgi:glutathione S-transferase kappa 1